jgi:hypothetical protein
MNPTMARWAKGYRIIGVIGTAVTQPSYVVNVE